MSEIPKKIQELLRKHNFSQDEAVWNCHGTWVVLHKAAEKLAHLEGITFEEPKIISADPENVVILAKGKLGDVEEWSFGEAAKSNTKNAYPYAMAEKRAKDRVILKLLGLHGDSYSQEESDDFKDNYGFSNSATQKEYKTMLDIITDNWSPHMCDLEILKPMFNRASKAGEEYKIELTATYKKLQKLEQDLENEANNQ